MPLTSYYHLMAFLEPFEEEAEAFLKQVLYNKHFKLMCGSHAGFGYTFENVLAAALIMRGKKTPFESSIPINLKSLKESKILEGLIKWGALTLEEEVLYQTPQARAVDALLLQEGVLTHWQQEVQGLQDGPTDFDFLHWWRGKRHSDGVADPL